MSSISLDDAPPFPIWVLPVDVVLSHLAPFDADAEAHAHGGGGGGGGGAGLGGAGGGAAAAGGGAGPTAVPSVQ